MFYKFLQIDRVSKSKFIYIKTSKITKSAMHILNVALLMYVLRGYFVKNNQKWVGCDLFNFYDFYKECCALYDNDEKRLNNDLVALSKSPMGFFSAIYNKYFNLSADSRIKQWFSLAYHLRLFLDNRDVKWFKQWLVHFNISMFGTLEYIRKRKILIKRNFVLARDVNLFNFSFIASAGSVKFVALKHYVNNLGYLLNVFYRGVRTVVLPIFVSLLLGVILLNYFSVNFLKNVAAWVVVGLIFFWLMSGFNFFVKRYRFGKYTSAIQRFWKRTNAYFWLIEGFLFLLFFYYYLNSSQEVYYFFDESNLNQAQLISLQSFYFSNIILLFLIFYSIYILLNINSYTFKQLLTHLTVTTLGLILIFLLECYQFYYIISMFYESSWMYNGEVGVWGLTVESPKIRAKQQYFILALIAKYWHFLFIFFSWLFVVFKSYELKRINYVLFGVNVQNLILLLLLNSLFVANWIKWVIRRFYDVSYYWFFSDVNSWASIISVEELFVFFQALGLGF